MHNIYFYLLEQNNKGTSDDGENQKLGVKYMCVFIVS